jgi:Superfamily I DNA and RNA helicases
MVVFARTYTNGIARHARRARLVNFMEREMDITENISSSAELTQRFYEAKHDVFNRLYAKLNDRQREAVFTVEGPLLVLAGAGSGKTTVLVQRIAFMIKFGNAYYSQKLPAGFSESDITRLQAALAYDREGMEAVLGEYIDNPCPPWTVLAITFTNKAAGEMKNRIGTLLGEDLASDIWAGTFHSICMRILRKYTAAAGYEPGFTVCDSDDSKRLYAQCFKELNIDEKLFSIKAAQNAVSRAKDKLLSPADYATEAGSDFKLRQIASVYTLYQRKLLESNLLDFDDIIMQTVLLLRSCDEAREYYQNRFRYVCVDEYQDTNAAQLELVLLLSGRHRNLMVVGDDDQSIYKFRGATIENILSFDNYLPNAKIIKLEQNYRSTQNILSAANAVIRNNFGRRGKELWTDAGEGDQVVVRKLATQTDEAKFIINKIMELVIREKRHFSDFAVLYRINAQSNSLEQVFARSGVAYRIIGGTRFYERKEIKDIVAYLCVINNPADNLRLRRIINEPKRKIGEATVTSIGELADGGHISMFEVMENAVSYPAISKSAYKLREFITLIKRLRELSEQLTLHELVEQTIELSGYRAMLKAGGEAEEERLENVNELVSNVISYEQSHDEPSLSGFLEETALIADVDNYDSESDAVVLMTIHSAKGLEFPVVFVPGFEEGIFPGMQSVMYPDELEEERRLAYVALTRAKEKLFCLHVKERLIYGRTQYNQPSRFLAEIPDEVIEHEAAPKIIEKSDEAKSGVKERPRKNPISKEFLSKSSLAEGVGRTTGYDRFESGDKVEHLTFGHGTILTVREMGADLLYEIAFDTCGTKKLMATYAKLRRA